MIKATAEYCCVCEMDPLAGKGVSTDGIYLRQPALSGPENEIPRERVECVPAKLPGAIN